MEEIADAKDLKLGKIQEELHGLRFKMQDMDQRQQQLKKAIEAKRIEIELSATAGEEDGDGDQKNNDDGPKKTVHELTMVLIFAI